MKPRFKDRHEAGMLLGFRLAKFAGCPQVIVLALPPGGVPVGHAVAETLRLPLDVLPVRKLGFPGNEGVTFGAIGPDGPPVIDSDIITTAGLDLAATAAIVDRERDELARRDQAYRGGRPPPPVRDHTVILVDDGVATGAAMRAAIQCLRHRGARRITVAAPIAASAACSDLAKQVDEVVALVTAKHFSGIGRQYRNFAEVSDQEVIQLLELARMES